MPEVLHQYGPHFSRARLKAAERLNRPELRTVAGAARYLGIGQSTLYHYEDGTKRPSLEQLEEMAKAYGVLIGDLLPCSSLRSEEVAPIIAPLMAVPQSARDAFIRQMAAFAETLAGAVDDARVIAMQATEATKASGIAYASTNNSSARGDAPGSIPLPPRAQGDVDVDEEGDQREGNDQRPGRHAPHPTRKGRKPS